jgi:hypothetical protein
MSNSSINKHLIRRQLLIFDIRTIFQMISKRVATSNNYVAKSVLWPTLSFRWAFCNTDRPIMLIRLNLFVRMSCQPCLFACHASFSGTLVNEDIFLRHVLTCR